MYNKNSLYFTDEVNKLNHTLIDYKTKVEHLNTKLIKTNELLDTYKKIDNERKNIDKDYSADLLQSKTENLDL